jgi:hypothetical protein
MSRTYRLKEKYLIDENSVLSDWDRIGRYFHQWTRIDIDPNSKEGKKKLARFHSDAKHHFHKWRGPNWFHNMYAQRPYRRNCKHQLRKVLKDPDYEVQIRRKPYREYWD